MYVCNSFVPHFSSFPLHSNILLSTLFKYAIQFLSFIYFMFLYFRLYDQEHLMADTEAEGGKVPLKLREL
jgi:hypothetical protein